MLDALDDETPEMGTHVAIDGSDLPAYANGQRFLSRNGPERRRFSDPNASWDHRSAISTRKGGGFYGYKIHAAVCTTTGFPVAWNVTAPRTHEATAPPICSTPLPRTASPGRLRDGQGLRRAR